MSSLGRNDAFSVVGGAPNARIIEGHVSRVTVAGEIFIISPVFDAGLEFGPVQYSQVTPPVGADCIVAIMTGTTEAWLLSWDGPNAGLPNLGWHLIGGVGEPPFLNSWTNYPGGGGPFGTARFRKDASGLVTVSGLIANASPVATSAIFTLPVGYRPQADLIFECRSFIGSEISFRVDVRANGNVFHNGTGAATTYLSLDGIQFYDVAAPTTIPSGPTGPAGPQGPAGIPGTSLQQLIPTAKSGNYIAVSGDLVLMTGSFTVTLPSPALSGQVLGVRAVDARTGAAPVTITTPSGLILGLGIGVNNVGAASAVLGIQNAYMLLESDGTNWHVIAGEQDTGHIAFPFAAGEGNLSGHVASYRKRGDYVTLRGMTHFTSGTAPWPIGTLPVGFRPLNSQYVLTHGTTAAGNGQNAQMLAIEATGAITLDNIAALNLWSGNYANLAPLAFHAVG